MNNRELAALILLGGVVVWMFTVKGLRGSLMSIIQILVSPRNLTKLLALSAWTSLSVVYAHRLGLWDPGSSLMAVAWFFTGAVAWVMSIGDAAKPGFIASRVRGLVSVGVLVEFVANLYVLPLLVELPFQVLLVSLAMIGVVAESNPALAPVNRFVNWTMAIAGAAIITFVIIQLIQNWGTVDPWSLGTQLMLPVWLTLWAIPFVYCYAVFAGYETLFVRVRAHRPDKRLPAYTFAGLTTALGLSSRRVSGFNTTGLTAAANAQSFREVRRAVLEFELHWKQDRDARRIARMRLEWYAGVPGTRLDGRQLDRREFTESKAALDWVADVGAGWYEPGGRSRATFRGLIADLAEYGLPEDHGVVLRSRRDGQGWFAYRQTPSGYWFGVGARRERDHRWYYDGHRMPVGLPTRRDGWTDDADETRIEWLPEDPV